ncbi:MAG TPA: hypothetical protein VG826_05525 [Pirellulales bacterium]|nr:hypothetical protein [Pirellulales bacterium]
MKIGEGALEAMGRVGFDEIGQALKAFPDSIGPMEESGLPFTATPAIVSDQMGYHHEDSHLPPIQPMEPSMPEQELEIGE